MGVRVRQKKKGKGNPWWVFVTWKGKRTSRMCSTKATAEQVATIIEAQLKLNQFDWRPNKPKKKKPQFKAVAQGWIDITVPATCKESTAEDYAGMLEKHVLPFFEDMQIDEINSGKIKEFLFSKVNDGYSASTIGHLKSAVSGILTTAVDDELIPTNPACNLGRKFMKKIEQAIEARKVTNGDEGKGQPDPLKQLELKKLLDTAKRHYPAQYPLFMLLARTGCRVGEALALKWDDIDFTGRLIHFKRGYSRGRLSTLKSKQDRKVDMSKQLAEVLQAHKKRAGYDGEQTELALVGPKIESEYVFTNGAGNLIDENNWRRRVYDKVLEKAKLRRIRIHDLRHTYATIRINKGDNIADVSHQLGHHSVKFTMDQYYHWLPTKDKSEVDALDDPEYRNDKTEKQMESTEPLEQESVAA